MGFFDRFKKELNDIISNFKGIDEDVYDELLELLIKADVGVYSADNILEELKQRVKAKGIKTPEHLKSELKNVVIETLDKVNSRLSIDTKPTVIMMIGVNGVGKTTTTAKLANLLKQNGKKVLLAACDTFRAAASEQLCLWGERISVDVIKGVEGCDPVSVLYDAISAATSRGSDVIICDTAGRLHNKQNLMAELAKMRRVISQKLPDSSVESLLVLDATTGQNAHNQAKEFNQACGITGIVLTKLDGTAKGGVVLSISDALEIPIKFIGVGEKVDDLEFFNSAKFADELI